MQVRRAKQIQSRNDTGSDAGEILIQSFAGKLADCGPDVAVIAKAAKQKNLEAPVTHMTPLSELCRDLPIEVRRDAMIGSLGFVEIPLEHRLVFALSEELLRKASAVGGVAAVITNSLLASRVGMDVGLAVADNPRRTFIELQNRLAQSDFYARPSTTTIDASARVLPGAIVDPTGVSIGARCTIGPGAIIQQHTNIAPDARIMAGAVLGSDGFQTMRFDDCVIDMLHAGGIEVGARTVVMANAVVARAVFRQSTRIGNDCRIGNGAFVSHNVQIGDRTLIGHGSIVAGNCYIGSNVTIGPGAVCMDRLRIEDGAFVTAGAVVTKNVAIGERVTGNFAIRHENFMRFIKQIASTPSE